MRRHLASDRASPPAAARFPRYTAYLAQLPSGLPSFPACAARASILAELVGGLDLQRLDVPHDVALLLARPATTWIPEAHLAAALLAISDLHGGTDEEELAWLLERNRAMFDSLLFRALMAFFSPAALLEKAADRWSWFHRGTSLEVERRGAKEAAARLSFPPRLLAGFLLPAYAVAFQAALERSRATSASVSVEEVGPSWATYRARWS